MRSRSREAAFMWTCFARGGSGAGTAGRVLLGGKVVKTPRPSGSGVQGGRGSEACCHARSCASLRVGVPTDKLQSRGAGVSASSLYGRVVRERAHWYRFDQRLFDDFGSGDQVGTRPTPELQHPGELVVADGIAANLEGHQGTCAKLQGVISRLCQPIEAEQDAVRARRPERIRPDREIGRGLHERQVRLGICLGSLRRAQPKSRVWPEVSAELSDCRSIREIRISLSRW